jgi:hypothetical protein
VVARWPAKNGEFAGSTGAPVGWYYAGQRCECGCGKKVKNNKNRFLNGHYIRSAETRLKLSNSHKSEEVREKKKSRGVFKNISIKTR